MTSKRALEQRLSRVQGFDAPRAALEQYPTPAEIAAHLVHLADLNDDLNGVVVDLGAGTGILGLGAALRRPRRVIGIERDPAALALARDNERRVAPTTGIDWLLADATRPPLEGSDATVLMNPPFGAQYGNEGADRRFLDATREFADVVYSIHNAGSRGFVESFVADGGGEITHAYELALETDRQFDFHEAERETIRAECYRTLWPQA